jgi:poly(3-hydroxybutyrate) depolymerase
MYVNTPRKLIWLLVALGLVFLKTHAQTPSGQVVTFKSAKFQDRKLTFLLYKPASYKPTDRIPLLVYLHGSGSVGTDIEKVKEQGIAKLIEEGTKIPYLVVVPQLPPDMNNRWDPEFVNEFFKHIFFYYKIDRSRVYLTGYSMGGTGVWDYTTAFPKNITCAVPISGWGDKEKVCNMKDVPTWAFHGSKDVTVNPQGSRNLAAQLKYCNGNVALTEFPEGDHDIWRQAYNYPGLMSWINMNTKRILAPRESKQPKQSKQSKTTFTPTYKLPVALQGITGMIAGDGGELYGVAANSRPLIIKFDTTGRVHTLIKVNGVSNLAWTDMMVADNGYVYIADAGNDKFKRKFFQVYKVKYADLKTAEAVDAIKLEFTLPDGLSLDLRTLFVSDGNIYLLGPDQGKANIIVRIEDRPSEQQTASVVARCDNLKQFSITSSLYDPARKKLTVLDGDKLGVIDLSGGVTSISKKQPSITRFQSASKKGAMTEFNGKLLVADQSVIIVRDRPN